MSTDPDIQAQIYQSFLVEAPELLTAIEQELFELMEARSLERVHSLMRHAHTLKGAAASVERDLIKTVAHHLEDAFKALYDPELELDAELGSLLWEGYECLRLPLTAELMGNTLDEAEVLDRIATVFARMQDKMGDFLGKEAPLLESSDLGFDMVGSIVRDSMPEELDRLQQVIADREAGRMDANQAFMGILTQVEWVQGIAESYELTGMARIAQIAIEALESRPDQAVEIANAVLADLHSSRLQILEGDREAGYPSDPLRILAGETLTPALGSTVVEEPVESFPDPSPVNLDPYGSVDTPLIEALVEPNEAPGLDAVEDTEPVPFGLLDQLVGAYSLEAEESDPTTSSVSTDPYDTEDIQIGDLEAVGQPQPILDPSNTDLDREETAAEITDPIPLAEPTFSPFGLLDQLVSDYEPEDETWEDSSTVLGVAETGDAGFITESTESIAIAPSTPPETDAFHSTWIPEPQPESAADTSLVSLEQHSSTHDESSAPPLPRDSVGSDLTLSAPSISFTPPSPPPASSSLSASGSPIDQLLRAISQSEQTPSGTPSPRAQSPASSPVVPPSEPTQSIRVDLRLLDQLNHSVGELLITQDQQTLQTDQLHRQSRELQRWVDLCQQRIAQAQDRANRRSRQSRQSARTSGSEFDQLEMDTYSDLHVLLQSALESLVQVQEGVESISQFSQTSHLTLKRQRQVLSGAQADLLQARMVPLGTILNRFPRVLQQLTTLHRKPVDLELQGTQVLVDKAIAEKLYDPLLHLIRNAFSHGIESPEIRRQHGKSESGQIQIRAYHQGNRTTIEIRDDGGGLNWERIRQRGVERGLLSPQHAPHARETELIELLFQSGFSTAAEITDLSGRGVGLDAVRAQIQSVEGTISIHTTPGQGTTFILQLPLTLTTARLLVCHDQGISYALLSDSIKQILLPKPEQIQFFSDRPFLSWQQDGEHHLLPVQSLSDLIDYRYQPFLRRSSAPVSPFPLALGHRLATMPILLIRWGSQWVCLSVDQIIGEQELVIKTLGRRLQLPSYIQGYSVLGNGRLAMVMDTQELIHHRWRGRSALDHQADPIVQLQLGPATDQAPEQSTTPVSGQKPALSSGISGSTSAGSGAILVVDDSATQRQSVVLTLQKAGYTTLQAVDGQDAIEKLAAHAEIKGMICDIEMPRANGFEVLAHCRREPHLVQLPVIMLTSRSGTKHRQKALELGANGYITKPYSSRDLLDLLSAQALPAPLGATS